MKANRLLATASVVLGIVTFGAAFDASAQQSGAMANGQMNMSSGQMAMPAQAGGTTSASTQAFEQNAANMMKNMSAPGYTGDTDADFVAHMIPHHQGAVDQAKVELEYGKDPQMKALARKIIKAQNEEIAYMKRWQANHKESEGK
ncbi:MAG: DUF305 domain-containing protein [Paraburkholderia sp.]|uniref:CopM family metallochaperone n=1 Tax=Paraburkholderia sp. TaxID=1926495 RepID=UPI003C5B46B9